MPFFSKVQTPFEFSGYSPEDAHYSEKSSSDTSLIILIVQSRDTPAYLLCFLLEIESAAIK